MLPQGIVSIVIDRVLASAQVYISKSSGPNLAWQPVFYMHYRLLSMEGAKINLGPDGEMLI